jgi:hypothetical protein
MSVGAVRPERHDDVGANPSQMPDDPRDSLPRVRAVQMLVVIVEQGNVAHAQHRRGRAQLGLTNLRQAHRAGMPMIVRGMAAVPAAFTARGGQQKDVDAF